MLGETFTGKTSLVLRFAEGYYRDSARNPTVGAFFITKRLTVNGTTAKVQIWDTAGQEQFKRLAPMYYKNAAAAIICYDVTCPKSFETLECMLFFQMIRHLLIFSSPFCSNLSLLFCYIS
jgi:small GTP-binding protein